MISFIVYGEPVGKQRPRVVKNRNGKIVAYTPSKTKVYEQTVRAAFLKELEKNESEIDLAAAKKLSIYFWLKRPKSSKRKYPTVKPDIDNLIKSVLDALNGIAYRDDAQIIDISASKTYHDKNFSLVAVTIEDIE